MFVPSIRILFSKVEKSPINFTPNLAASSSLFDDDEGDDLFSPVPKVSLGFYHNLAQIEKINYFFIRKVNL